VFFFFILFEGAKVLLFLFSAKKNAYLCTFNSYFAIQKAPSIQTSKFSDINIKTSE